MFQQRSGSWFQMREAFKLKAASLCLDLILGMISRLEVKDLSGLGVSIVTTDLPYTLVIIH